MDKGSHKKIPMHHSIQFRITMAFTVLILLTVIIISSVIFQQSQKMVVTNVSEKALTTVTSLADRIDAARLQELQTKEDMENPYFMELGQQLRKVMDIAGAEYLYIMRKTTDGTYEYIIDGVDYDSDKPTTIGEVEDTIYEGFKAAVAGKSFAEKKISVDEYGALISAFAPVKDSSGKTIAFIGMDYNATQEHDAFIAFRGLMLALTIIIVIVSVALGVFVSRFLSKNIIKLSTRAEQIADGDLRVNEITMGGKSEIGLLADSFNTMISNMHSLISSIKGASEELETTAGTISTSSEVLTASGEEIASSLNEIALGADEQAKATTKSLEATGALSDVLTNMIAKLDTAVQGAENMRTRNATGLTSMTTLNDSYTRDAKLRATVNDEISSLAEKSQSIGEIVETIDAIAEQTNLLALNAAIEAARAGEHGRGFAVVAEEVRKLAVESSKATDEIRTTVSEIIETITNANSAMDKSNVLSKESAGRMAETRDVFSEISEAVEEVVAQIKSLQEDVDGIRQTEQVVVSSMENITSISQQTAASTQEISSSAEEQAESLDSVATSIQHLNKLVETLRSEINQFTV